VSPIRDPNARWVKRAQKSVVRGREEAERRGGRNERDDDNDTPAGAALPPGPPERWDDESLDAVPLREKHSGRRSDRAQRRFDRQRVPAPEPATAQASGGAVEEPATVVGTARGPCQVELSDGTVIAAHLPKALARDDKSEIAVGDRVLLARRASGEVVVDRVLPRTSRLSRPDPFLAHRERVLAANLDLAVVVASLRRPPLATGLIDRFLVALAHGDLPALLAVNKADLAEGDDDPELARLAPYRALGLPLVVCSARTGTGLAELGAAIAGKTVAFVGHSGVGKSSLLNALLPEAGAAVAEVSSGNTRGRHTTTRARIYRRGDTRLVDTPGVREFGLWKMTPRELAGYFDEFGEAARACRFTDCTHSHEPSCGVRAAAERGEIAEERYRTYLRVLASLDEA
jgi:ribosome biogenesis GTPase